MTAEIITKDNPFIIGIPQTLEEYESLAIQMSSFVEQLSINNQVAYNTVTELYSKARDLQRRLEAERKEKVQPHRQKVNEINDRYASVTDPLEAFIEMANAKAAEYLAFLEQQKVQETKQLFDAASLFDAEMDVYVPPVPTNVKGKGASLLSKTEKKFRVVDLEKVPRKYLQVDEKALERAIKLGISEIPGIELYEETKTQLRTR